MPLTTPPGLRSFVTGNTAGPASAGQNSEGDRGTFLGFEAGFNNGNAVGPVPADDVVMIGHQAGRDNKANDAVIIGSGAAPNLQFAGGNNDGAVVIGRNALNLQGLNDDTGEALVVIGRNAAANTRGNFVRTSVIIGTDALQGSLISQTVQANVIIGHRAGGNLNGNTVAASVLIGRFAGEGPGAGISAHSGNVFIGDQAGRNNVSGTGVTGIGNSALLINSSGQRNTALGALCMDSTTTGSDNTAVGASALSANSAGANNVAIGKDADIDNLTGSANVVIGQAANADNGQSYNNSIIIGRRAAATGTAVPVTTGAFVVESVVGIGVNAVPFLFGDMANGNLVLGDHANAGTGAAIDRDTGNGTCTLKLQDASLNGAPTNAPGGGMFLWFDSTAGVANGELRARAPGGAIVTVATL